METLVKIPSPTGFTDGISDFLAKHATEKGIDCRRTRKGAIIYSFEKPQSPRRLMFAAHVDALGAMVSTVTKDKISISSIGSYPVIYIIGDYCTVHSYDGKQYRGTILPHNPSDHLNKKLRESRLTFADLYVRLDLIPKRVEPGVDYIGTGNFVSFDPRYEYINGFIKARHLDDKAGAAVLLGLADLLAENQTAIAGDNSVYLFFNISEETGQGLAGFPEIDELLVVDMGCVGDHLEGREAAVSICPADALGPYNYRMTRQLIALASANDIDHKIDVSLTMARMDLWPYAPAAISRSRLSGRRPRSTWL